MKFYYTCQDFCSRECTLRTRWSEAPCVNSYAHHINLHKFETFRELGIMIIYLLALISQNLPFSDVSVFGSFNSFFEMEVYRMCRELRSLELTELTRFHVKHAISPLHIELSPPNSGISAMES